MRDHELMLSLLRMMAGAQSGRIISREHLGMSEEDQHERHNLELLVDMGLAEWAGSGRSIARITSDGYTYLEAHSPDTGD